MIDSLYECFRHWSNSGSVYIYSDTHFDDDDCKLMDSNWPSPDEQVKILNSIVYKSDTLVLLGDVGDLEYVKKLKAGYKVLITGNHDIGATNYKRREEYFDVLKEMTVEEAKKEFPNFIAFGDCCGQRFAYCDNKLFDEVYTGPLMISDKIILSHEPIEGIDWALNIHGHNHSGATYTYGIGGIKRINVCSNVNEYKPINLKDIIKSGILNKIDSIHRITIDEASGRK